MPTQNSQPTHVKSLPKGLALIPPPPEVVYASPGTPPLDTSNIGLFAYYQPSTFINLSKAVSPLLNYTWGGNYVDGYIRIWQSNNNGTTSIYDGDSYIDIAVRIRADGWILAWFNRQQERAEAIWWGYASATGDTSFPTKTGNENERVPITNSTRLGRAIQLICESAGLIDNFNWNQIGYYDYEYPSATRMFIFGHAKHVWAKSSEASGYSVTSDFNINALIKGTIYYAGILYSYYIPHLSNGGYSSTGNATLCLDGTQLYTVQHSGSSGAVYVPFQPINITSSFTSENQHTFRLYSYVSTDGGVPSVEYYRGSHVFNRFGVVVIAGS